MTPLNLKVTSGLLTGLHLFVRILTIVGIAGLCSEYLAHLQPTIIPWLLGFAFMALAFVPGLATAELLFLWQNRPLRAAIAIDVAFACVFLVWTAGVAEISYGDIGGGAPNRGAVLVVPSTGSGLVVPQELTAPAAQR
ncbi:MAG: hypothetical protein ACRD2E_00605 [Terriglobales bacterium]